MIRPYIYILISFLLLAGIALGGLDQSEANSAKNLSMADFSAMGFSGNADNEISNAGAPEAIATDAGTELATYTDQAPPSSDLEKLMPSSVTTSPPTYMYYNGEYMGWSDFSATFPRSQPGLWIQRAVSWSLYATLPLGGWTQELLYVPISTPVIMYEIYPGGFVTGYNLGFVQPGYYYVWYYADAVGRHRNVFATSLGYSNTVIIDVYAMQPIKPDPKKECEKYPNCRWVNGQCVCPDPKKECEKSSNCKWVNGNCQCWMPEPDPKKECEQNANCQWVNGNCQCWMPKPDPKQECESKSYCQWVNGQCLCTMPNPEKEQCESNPLCDYVNGQCLCRGVNPEPEPQPEPMPEPVPNPEPYNPAPNPVAQCEENPSCHWTNGQCLCTGLSPIESSVESSSNLGTTGESTSSK